MGGRAFTPPSSVRRAFTPPRSMGGTGLLAAAVGVVAAVAFPYVVPAIASAIGASAAVSPLIASTVAGGLYGTATGALAGSITGDMGRGAALGGVGGTVGGFVQGGGIGATQNALFGAPTETVVNYTAPTAASVAPVEAGGYVAPGALADGTAFQAAGGFTDPNLAASGMSYETLATAPISSTGIGSSAAPVTTESSFGQRFYAGLTGQPVVSGAAAAAAPTTTGGTGLVTGAAPGFSASVSGAGVAAPSFFSAEGLGRAVGNFASGLTTPAGIASVGQLAMTMYNRPPQDLTPEERDYVRETAELASTNRDLFEQRVSAARRLLQQGTPNPEQAYAQARLGAERSFLEGTSRSEEDLRRARIFATERGAAAAAANAASATEATRAGLAALPTTAPVGPAGLAMPAFRDVEERRRQFASDISRGVGGIAGALAGTNNKSSLFGSIA